MTDFRNIENWCVVFTQNDLYRENLLPVIKINRLFESALTNYLIQKYKNVQFNRKIILFSVLTSFYTPLAFKCTWPSVKCIFTARGEWTWYVDVYMNRWQREVGWIQSKARIMQIVHSDWFMWIINWFSREEWLLKTYYYIFVLNERKILKKLFPINY